jgi:hypothetical protein
VTDIDKLSEDQADAMVAAMLAAWKRSIDEVDRLRAENQRLRALLPKLLALLEVARKWEDGLASPMELALAVLDVDEPPHKKET